MYYSFCATIITCTRNLQTSHEKATLSRLASHQLSKPADKGPHKSALDLLT